jgi:hypothetical protein
VVLSTVVPTSFAAVDSLDKMRFRFIAGHIRLSFAGNRHRRGRVASCHLIWLLSIKLGSWSCRLWYQHPSRLLTLWTKRDSGLLRGIFEYLCRILYPRSVRETRPKIEYNNFVSIVVLLGTLTQHHCRKHNQRVSMIICYHVCATTIILISFLTLFPAYNSLYAVYNEWKYW